MPLLGRQPVGALVSVLLLLACAPAGAPAARPAGAVSPAIPASLSSTPLASAEPTSVLPTAPTAVRAGVIGSSSDAALYLAAERGYFQQQGLAVILEPIRSATDVVAALGTGALDAAGGGLNPGLFNALHRGVAVRIVADKGTLRAGFGYESFMVRRDLLDSGRFADYRDVRGLKVALNNLASIEAFLLARVLDQAGLRQDDVEVVQLSFADQLAAFGNRAIDASTLIEPFVARAEDSNLATSFVTLDKLALDQQLSVLMYGSALVQGGPEIGRRFMVAYVQGVRDYNDAFLHGQGTDAVIDVLTRETTIKDAALWRRITPPGLNPNGSASRESIAQVQDFFIAQGHVPERVEMDQLLDNSYVEYALQRLGPYAR
jgi:NitT/TauT family transport system substrate-binding protein